jgi:hypothetical protein
MSQTIVQRMFFIIGMEQGNVVFPVLDVRFLPLCLIGLLLLPMLL